MFDKAVTSMSDIDRGYAWVIVVCSFLSQVVLGGSCIIYGQLYLELIHTFTDHADSLMIVVAVQCLALYGCSLFAGVACSLLGVRKLAVIGIMLTGTGFIVSSLSNNLGGLIFGYGILEGCGLSFHYMAVLTIVQQYFKKRRSFASGIACSGIGFGVFTYSSLVRVLIEEYGWRGTLLILAALYFQCLVFAALMRPPILSKTRPNSMESHGSPKQFEDARKTPNKLSLSKTENFGSTSLLGISSQEINILATSSSKKDISKANDLELTKSEVLVRQKVMKCMADTFQGDIQLFLNAFVVLHFLASATMSVCSGVPYNFLPVKCIEDGLSKKEAAFIISCMGISDIIGRLTFGWIGMRLDVTILYAITCGIVGVSVGAVWFAHNFEGILIVGLAFAFGQGGVFTTGVQSIVKYVGVKNFSKVFGLMMVAKAVGYGAAGPFGAYLADQTGSQSTVFLVVGFFALSSTLLMVVVLVLDKFDIAHIEKEEDRITEPDV